MASIKLQKARARNARACGEYVRAQRRLQGAGIKVRDFTARLFAALKEQEDAEANYAKAAREMTQSRERVYALSPDT